MIKKLYINGFKCHDELTLEFSNLTFLVGTNSSGKSSVIQAILLAVHNVTNNGLSPLNGHLISLGKFDEVTNFVTNSHNISIEAYFENGRNLRLFFFKPKTGQDVEVTINTDDYINEHFNYSNNYIHYMSSNRIGAQDIYNKNIDSYDKFGILGEFAIDHFETNKSEPLDDDLAFDKTSLTLAAQVNYWLNRISQHELETNDIPGTNYLVARFKTKSDQPTPITKIVKPINTGSGVSYLANILITCLSAKKGDLVIIENPEIHLHPRAQSLLVDFFVFISKYGIQLVIETHSDHIFNGTRVHIYEKKLSASDVSVHFFTKDNETLASKHSQIILNEGGRIENQKELLFDQFDYDINSLLGIY